MNYNKLKMYTEKPNTKKSHDLAKIEDKMKLKQMANQSKRRHKTKEEKGNKDQMEQADKNKHNIIVHLSVLNGIY